MYDPSGALSFLLSLSDEWRNPKEALIHPLADIENEPAYRKALAEGHSVRWVTNHRRFHREGWKPVTERDKVGRPTVFVDKNKKSLLMYRPADKA